MTTPTLPKPAPTKSARLERLVGAVLLAAVVAAPVDLAHLGLPTLHEARQAVALRYLPLHLALGLAGLVGWLAWIWIITTIAAETADTLKRRARPRQRALHSLAAPIVALLLSVAPRPAHDTPAAAADSSQPASPPPHSGTRPARGPDSARTTALEYVVKPGDNLWDLAFDFYGDGYAFERIWHASGLADPRHLHPGQILTIPSDGLLPPAHAHLINPQPVTPPATTGDQVTVRAGQSLWSIAQVDLGAGGDWPAVWAANANRPEPDGTLQDPNLIRPGWQLTLPHPTKPHNQASQPAPSKIRPNAHPNQSQPQPPKPTATHMDEPAAGNHQTVPSRTGADQRRPEPPASASPTTISPRETRPFHIPAQHTSGWDLPRQAGEGAVLLGATAVGVWGLRRRLRRAAHNHLPPGHRLAPTPADQHPATAAVNVEATRAAPDANMLHTALGHLETAVAAWPAPDRPWLVGVRTQADHAELIFDSPTLPAPTPFTQTSPHTWTITNPPPAPTPPGPGLLVCVGWQKSAWVWVDLQVPARISLTGPHATTLARLWAAAVAGAEICDGARVTTVDLEPLPGTRPQIAAAVEEDLASWAAEADRHRGVAWWGDPDRPPAELIVSAHPITTPPTLGRGVALIAVNDPNAAWTINTAQPT